MLVSVIQRADGGVSFAPIVRDQRDDETDEEFLHACSRRLVAEHPDGVFMGTYDAATLPNDREFRNAWTWDGAVTIDMVKARDIQREKLRTIRKPLLEALDIEMTRAYKDPALQDQIDAERHVLRDVTSDPAIEAAQTPDELKAVMPNILKIPQPGTP
jgi:hypothetical protein